MAKPLSACDSIRRSERRVPCRRVVDAPRLSWHCGFVLLLGLLLNGPAIQADEAPPAKDIGAATLAGVYLKQIKPLFREKCFSCHGALKQATGLRVDSVALMRQGGSSGPIVVAGSPDTSPLIERITSSDPAHRMPFEATPLTAPQIDLVRTWIAAGAPAPEKDQPELDPRDHWSFRTPVRPAVPLPASTEDFPIRNPIDAFVEATRQQRGVPYPRPAPPEALLRRVYFDLTGLPPTREELAAFLADSSDAAYERVVDRLLKSPQHGERWARHWMDVWRYADWFGRRSVPDVWNSAPQIWRWRDWIVRSLNSDTGYDQMIREMLAADELRPGDQDSFVATGFLARNWYALNHNQWMRENVEHTAKAFLGLTYNCAHCHDHKYDPISQADYFRLRACFEPLGMRQDRVPGEPDPGAYQEYNYLTLRKIQRLGSIGVFDKNIAATTWFYTGGDERNRVTEKGNIPPGIPAVFQEIPFDVQPIQIAAAGWYPGSKEAIRQTERQQYEQLLAAAQAALPVAQQQADKERPALVEKLTLADIAFQAAVTAAISAGQNGALAGKQSLVLDAGTGRRILNNALPGSSDLVDGTVLQFQLRILKDAHFNMQLAGDVIKGLTAGMIAFDAGRILSYQPGNTNEFEAGRYDFAAGQRLFHIRFDFEPTADRCLMSVHVGPDKTLLVDRAPVALNGWNPARNPVQAITFDARPGSHVILDDISLTWPAGTTLRFDFEAPACGEGADVVGKAGWSASSFAILPGTSVVTALPGSPEVDQLRQQLLAARQGLDVLQLRIDAAAAQVKAAQVQQILLATRSAADDAKLAGQPEADARAQAAETAERQANLLQAEATLLARQVSVADAEAKPIADAQRMQAITTARGPLPAAEMAVALARMQINQPLTGKYSPLGIVYPQQSSGRRAALAKWITDPRHPLTPRVAVNHIWLRHFHQPLVATVFDFGRNGKSPTHPELLDWLAVELVQSGWSMRHVHRLIVTSSTYRQSSSLAAVGGGNDGVARARKVDPENQYLWRMPTGRMESEVVRDSLLALSGRLDLKLGGQELENSEAFTTHRRSLYYSCYPEIGGKSALGELFDAPDAAECYRRSDSIIPQQGLALTNSPWIHDLSIAVERRLTAQLANRTASTATAGSPATTSPGPANSVPLNGIDVAAELFIRALFEEVLTRAPTAAEIGTCKTFLQEQTDLLKSQSDPLPDQRARESLVRGLLNHNDFITIR